MQLPQRRSARKGEAWRDIGQLCGWLAVLGIIAFLGMLLVLGERAMSLVPMPVWGVWIGLILVMLAILGDD